MVNPMNSDLRKYKQLIFDFVVGNLAVGDFKSSYLKMVKEEQKIFGDEIHQIIGTLFSDLEDAYCVDPKLRDEADINEKELLIRARISLKQLLDY